MQTKAYISRNEAAELSGAPLSVVNKAVEQKAVRTRKVGTRSTIDVRDVSVLWIFAKLPFALPVKLKRTIAAWARDARPGEEFALSESVVVRKSDAMDKPLRRAQRYIELRDRFLEVNPDVQGGEPVIRGTRVPVRGLAKQIGAGESDEVLRREYDYIDPDAFEFAVLWANANPRRGRPTRAGRHDSRSREPERRAQVLAKRRGRAGTPA